MQCPLCQNTLSSIQYEGIAIETCDACEGEWLDGDELGKIVDIREVRFDTDQLRAIAETTPYTGIKLETVDRSLDCPGCGWAMEPFNYGGGTGLILDKCKGCGGYWLDDSELEKVQMLVEGWEDCLPDDLKRFGSELRQVEVRIDKESDVKVSRIPVIGRFINACVNGILDLA